MYRVDPVIEKIRVMVDEAYERAKAEESAEISAGRILRDDPVTRQIMHHSSHAVRAKGIDAFETFLERQRGKRVAHCSAAFTATTYLESRRSWKAYSAACELLSQVGRSEFEGWLYPIFHYVPGVMMLVSDPTKRILVCVRSAALAGTHTGMLSFPAGLMKPGESFKVAAERQVRHETGVSLDDADWGDNAIFVARNPDAPQSVYCREVVLQQPGGEPSETWEAVKKRFVWVPINAIRSTYWDDMLGVRDAFAKHDIDLPEETTFAPDARQAIREFFIYS